MPQPATAPAPSLRHLITFLLLPLALLGCGFQDDQPAPADGGQVRFLSGTAVKTLDPQLTSWMVDFRIIEGLFEPLLRVDPATLELEPAAAEAMPEVSDDGLTYTFTIRDDARWSNGDPVTASDYAYGWKRALLPDLAADYVALFFCIEGAQDFYNQRAEQLSTFESNKKPAGDLWDQTQQRFADTVGIEATGDRTLRVTLREPTAYFNELVAFAAFSPVHEASADPHLQLNDNSGAVTMDPGYFRDPGTLIANGPYVLGSWQPRQQLVLEQNPHWWNRAAMKNSQVVMEVADNPGTALTRYERGEVDWYPDLPTNAQVAADLVAAGRDDVHTGPAAGTYFYVFNCLPEIDGKPNPLADPRVRRALSLAVDRRHLVDNVTRLGQPVARSFVPPTAIPAYQPPVEAGVGHDPDEARRLLAEAGYPDGRGITGLTLLYNNEGGHQDSAEAIKNAWRQTLGVNVTLEPIERIQFSDRLRNQSFTIARAGWFGDYRDPTTFLDKFQSANGNNDGKYHNPEYDRLLDEARTILDPDRRMAKLAEAEALLLAEQPLMPLYHYTNLELFDLERVTGIHVNPWNVRRLETIEATP